MAETDSRILSASDDALTVVAFPSPLRSDRVVRSVPIGATVAELLDVAGVGVASGLALTVWLDGIEVPREWWGRVRPKAGTTLLVRGLPHGGGRGGGKAIIGIIIGIALILITFGAGAPIGLAAPVTALGKISSGIAGIMAVAGGIVSLVSPPPAVPFDGDIPTSRESPALLGTRNTGRPYEAKRRVLGRHLVFPDYAARPYTERIGPDQWVRLLFEVGYGPLALSELKIGDTPLEVLTTEYNVLQGFDDDPDLEIFTTGADEAPLAILLEITDPLTPWLGTTALATTGAAVEISFPVGLICYKTRTGTPGWVSVDIRFEFREVGDSGAWTPVDAKETPTGDLGPGVTNRGGGLYRFKGKEQGQLTRGVAWDLPASGQYDIRVTNEAVDYRWESYERQTNTFEDAVWTLIRSTRPGTPPRVDNLCLVEMRVKATDQLSGLIDTFNCIAESILPVWTAVDEWGPPNRLSTNTSLQPTRNPAWCYAEYLRGPVNKSPIPDDRIDALALKAWADQIENAGRKFDAVVDFRSTVFEMLRDIAGAGRASFSLVDGRYGIVVDGVKPTIVQHFTARNVSGFGGTKVFRKEPHAFRVSFVNPAAGWQPDIRMVYADGYSADGAGGTTAASEFEDLALWGTTDPDWAYRDARYHMAASRLRPEVYHFSTDVEHLPVTRGDRVKLQHDVMKVGLAAGRITALNISGETLISFVIDEEIAYDPALEIGWRIRTKDGGTLEGRGYSLPDPGHQVVDATGFDLAGVTDPEIGDLAMVGEYGIETVDAIVFAVTPLADLRARIELVDYSPEIFDADTEEIPPFDPSISDPRPKPLQLPPAPIIESVVSDESVLEVLDDGTLVPRIVVTVSLPDTGGIPVEAIASQFRTSDPAGDWHSLPLGSGAETKISVKPVYESLAYDVRVRSIASDGRASEWNYTFGHVVVGTAALPPAPETVRLEPPKMLVWEYPDPPRDLAGFKIKHQAGVDSTWATGLEAHGGLITETRFSLAQLPAGQRTVMIKAVDRGGRESEEPAAMVVDLAPADVGNVTATRDEHALGFTGTKVDCTVNGGTGDLEADSAVLPFWEGADSTLFWGGSDSELFWGAGYLACSYEWAWTLPPGAAGSQLTVDLTIVSSAWSLLYRRQGETAWSPMPSAIVAEQITYEFRIEAAGGVTPMVISQLVVSVDVPDLREYLNDIVTAAGGQIIPPTAPFIAITEVYIRAVQVNGAGGISAIVTKQAGWAQAGVTVQVVDQAGAGVVGLIDIEYVGY